MKKLNELYYFKGNTKFYIYRLNKYEPNSYNATVIISYKDNTISFDKNWDVWSGNIHIKNAKPLKEMDRYEKMNVITILFEG